MTLELHLLLKFEEWLPSRQRTKDYKTKKQSFLVCLLRSLSMIDLKYFTPPFYIIHARYSDWIVPLLFNANYAQRRAAKEKKH
jgi:hypothetical protein